MRVLVLEPGYCPYDADFPSVAEAVRRVVKGDSENSLPFDNEVIALVSSREQEGMPHNRIISDSVTVNGRCLICGWNGQQLIGLTKAQAARYGRRFFYPEKTLEDGESIMTVPQTPKVKPKDERFGRKPSMLER